MGERTFDVVYGAAGNDLIVGSESEDCLAGGAGDDWLRSGGGSDTLMGGSGNDRFILDFGREVLIADFEDGQDLIQLPVGLSFEALRITQSGNQAVSDLGNQFSLTILGVGNFSIGPEDFIQNSLEFSV